MSKTGLGKLKYIFPFAVLLAISGCAADPEDIKQSYISPLIYNDYTCRQVASETNRVGRELAEVTGIQQDKATTDKVATGVGIILFWPALFFINQTDNEEAVSRLKGEYKALEQISVQKDCRFTRVPLRVSQ